MMSKRILIKESNIHGLGLFASEHIEAGDVIGEIEPIPSDENGPHVLWVDENEGYLVTGPLKYINHSAEPNACYCDDLTVVAIDDIAPGDEITHDYGEEWRDE